MEEKLTALPPLTLTTVPVGSIVAFVLSEKYLPSDWLVCDGTVIPVEYKDLIDFTGGNTTPNLVGVTLIGSSTQHRPTPIYPLCNYGGEEKHILSINEMPSHNHTINGGDFGLHSRSFKGNDDSDLPFETNPSKNISGTDVSGGNVAHNNMPPYYAINYIIYAGKPKINNK